MLQLTYWFGNFLKSIFPGRKTRLISISLLTLFPSKSRKQFGQSWVTVGFCFLLQPKDWRTICTSMYKDPRMTQLHTYSLLFCRRHDFRFILEGSAQLHQWKTFRVFFAGLVLTGVNSRRKMREKQGFLLQAHVQSLQSRIQLTLQNFYDILESSLNYKMTDFHNLSHILFLQDPFPKITVVLLYSPTLCLFQLLYTILWVPIIHFAAFNIHFVELLLCTAEFAAELDTLLAKKYVRAFCSYFHV